MSDAAPEPRYYLHPVPVMVEIAGRARATNAYAVVEVVAGDLEDPARVLVRVADGIGAWKAGDMRVVDWTRLMTLADADAILHRAQPPASET